MQCMRGFSYMPQKLLEPTDLKLVEPEELDRNWRATRRERLKEQEKKIYEEFVQEKDVVYSVLEDDRYQFLYELPETCIRELMEAKPKVTQKDDDSSDALEDSVTDTDTGTDSETPGDPSDGHGPYSEDQEANNEIFQIFDDDISADEQDQDLCDSLNGSLCTVRQKDSRTNLDLEDRGAKHEHMGTNIIENSIYCAKVKDLRTKINNELLEIRTELENKEIKEVDAEPLRKMMKCANEFCARFNRVHMYQMKRQIGDIERHNSLALPFAKHTQFQSQMVRIISLHQNLLHSLQVFHKSYEQTLYLRECVPVLRSLAQLVRSVTGHCFAVECPPDFAAAKEMYRDDISHSTEKLEEVLNEYASRLAQMVSSHNLDDPTAPIKSSGTKTSLTGKDKKRMDAKSKRAEVESRLSMYSLEVRRNPVKMHVVVGSGGIGPEPKPTALVKEKKEEAKKEKLKDIKEASSPPKRSSHSRRPLMRDPNSKGPPKHKVMERESEIKTMVENFDAASSFISREDNPCSAVDLKNRNPRTPRGWVRKEVGHTAAKNLHRQPILRVTRPIERTPRCLSPKSSPKRRENKLYQAVNKILSPLMADPHSTKIAHVQQIKVKLSPKEIREEDEIQTISPPAKEVRPSDDGETAAKNKPTLKEKKEAVPAEIPSSRDGKNTSDITARDLKNHGDKVSDAEMYPTTDQCEVSQLLRRLCCGDAHVQRQEERGDRFDRISGSRNAQLICTTASSPRNPSTTELLRILEETIQKKTPREFARAVASPLELEERMRLVFKIPERVTDSMFQYRTRYVQHMLASPMYANSVVGKPWEVVSSVSEEIIEDMLLRCALDMEIQKIIREMYLNEIY